MSKQAVLGIDFGSVCWTAYISCDGQRTVVSDERGNRFIDACIYIRDSEIIIGSSAQQLAQTYPENVIMHPLHYLDNRACKNNCNSKLRVSYQNDKPVFTLPFTNKDEIVKLETIIVECFKKIYDLSVLTMNVKPCLTTISVSESVYSTSKDFLIRCANKAQIPYPSLVCHHQSVLSYLEISHSQPDDQTLALLDLPSNTPTLTILSVENQLYKTIASQTLPCQVGEAIDELLFEYILKEACRKMGEDVRYSKKAIAKIQKELGGCKERLANTMTTSIMIESLFDGMDFTLSLTRSRFDMIIYPVISKILTCVQSALQELQVEKEMISQLFVFGGSAAIPSLQEAFKKMLGERVVVAKRCQEVVAEGAAVHAAYKQEFQLKKELPQLQQMAGDLKIKAGLLEYVVVEEKTPLPVKRQFKKEIDCESKVVSVLVKDVVIGEIPFDNELNGKELNIKVAGNQFDGITLTFEMIKDNETIEQHSVRIHE